MPKKFGIMKDLCRRELGVKSNYRFNTNIIKKFISQEDTTFSKFWESHSKTTIYYDQSGLSRIPQILYKLKPVPTSKKIEDGICCQISPDECQLTDGDSCHSCFLALTADNWLYRLNLENGVTLQSIYLSSQHKFRHISWETEGHTVTVKSTLSNRCDNRRESTSLLCAMIFFKMFPLQFLGLMEITRERFGKDISDAVAMDGLLMVCHHGLVRIYSLQFIFDNWIQLDTSTGQPSIEQHQIGFPLNIDIKTRPPVLFEVRCHDNDLQFGGYPWQYIIKPKNQHNTFQIHLIDTPDICISNGLMKYENSYIEPDRALFHMDNSGRIIHYSSTEFRLLRLCMKDASMPVLEMLFSISLNEKSKQTTKETYTASGRRVKHTVNYDSADDAFLHTLISFHYEDDLDIISILVANPTNSSCHKLGGNVHLYDNQTGQLIRIVELKELWEEDSEHNLRLDCDVLVHIVKNPRSYSSCYVYSSIFCDS